MCMSRAFDRQNDRDPSDVPPVAIEIPSIAPVG
jgi:hypothetical protein